MRYIVWRFELKPVSFLLGLAMVGLNLMPLARAQTLPTPPPDQGAPTGRQRGGASRGDCRDYQDLTALVPVVDGIVWSQTASATPSFFFHLPNALDQTIPLEFVVQDSRDNYAYRKQFSGNIPAGILAIPVPSESSGLTPGEAYTWTFSIYCDAARPSASVFVSGTISRVAESAVTGPSSNPTPAMRLDLARQYAAEGLWHEAIEITLSLYQAEPGKAEYLETLESLFEAAGLDELSPTISVHEVPE
ncbi:MAG: DUF928 domain-containing protein [Leptolyngbya sp. SIO4C5]|nr:DUF928 domain-containing protein [Leptolyngbya sp. SIO4C5]